ncbi:hypothetical protein MASR2M74_03120 [Paracoccaceae bacterium]
MAGNLRVSMLFEAETGRARSAIAGLRGETDQLGAAVAKAGQGARTGGAGISAAGEASHVTAAAFVAATRSADEFTAMTNIMRAAANPLVAMFQENEAALRAISVAEDLGALTAREAALATDQLARSQIQLQAAISAGGGAIEANTRAVVQHETALQRLIAQTTSLTVATEGSIAAELQRGYALDATRAKFDPLFAASRQYEMQLEEIAEAERMGALSALGAAQARERAAQAMTPVVRQVGQTAAASNAHLANLGFQANDIFMMMAAGQNPMMLAIQQGTQVTQVFQGLRREGQALGPAIRSALMGMVSPMSLVTMGVIALGAYAVQALMSSGEAALTFDDRLKALNDTMSSLRENSRLLIDDGVSAKFGAMQQQARQLVDALVALDRASELKQLRTTLDARFAQDIEPSFLQKYSLLLAQGQAPNFPNVDLAAENFNELGTSMSFEDFKQMRAEIDQLAADGKIEEVTAKIVELGLAMKGDGQFSALGEGAQGLFRDLAKLALGTAETEAIFNGSARREAGNARADELIAAAGRENELARLKLAYGEQSAEVRAEEARQARAALETEIQRLGIGEASSRAEQMRADLAERFALAEAARIAAARTAADQMLAQHQQEARIVELTARWGADSLEVAYARAAAERQVYEAQLAAQGISGELADDLMDAWDAARGVAAINMAAGIAAAAGQAMLLAQNLGISLRNAAAIANVGLTVSDGSVVKPGGTPAKLGGLSFGGVGSVGNLGVGGGFTFGDNPGAGNSVSLPTAGASGAGKAGGGGGAKKEADAYAQLYAELNRQIEALRVLDPVQEEILKNHEALKDASDREKESVADLIAERMRLEEVRDRLDQIGETGRNAFQQLLSGATSFGGALAMVLDKLAEMLASDAWDMIWGGGGLNLGGLIGSLFGLAPAKADGGKVTGPGGPRDDNLLHWLSNGEFVVNAAATRNAQPLLEAINAGVPVDRLVEMIGGRRPGFADGGLVGSSAPRGWRMATDSGSAGSGPASTGGAGGKMQLDIRIGMDRDHNWKAAVRDIATDTSLEVSQIVVDEWSRQALPGRVAEIDSNPRVRG